MSRLQFSKCFYTKNERQNIIDHIIEKNLYFAIRGRFMWQEMERLKICPGRTWQSLKQHFKSNLINSLDTVNISELEKKRILECYYKMYQCSPEKRKQFFDERNKNCKKKKISKYECLKERTEENLNNKECNRKKNDVIAEKHLNNIVDETASCANQPIEMNLETTENSLEEEPFSENEDRIIIIFIKENMNWAELRYFNDIYKNCHQQVLKKRSPDSIKNRFLNHILPYIYKYNIIELDEIPLFYDRAGVEIPSNLDETLYEYLQNKVSLNSENSQNRDTQKNDSDNQDTSLEKNTPVSDTSSNNLQEEQNNRERQISRENNSLIRNSNVAVQTNNFMGLAKYVCNQLCLTIDNEEHIFISKSDNNSDIINKLYQEYHFSSSNIHIIDNKSYTDLEKVKKLQDDLDKKMLNIKDTTIINFKHNLSACGSILCECKKLKVENILHLPMKNTCVENCLIYNCKCKWNQRINQKSKLKISNQNSTDDNERNCRSSNMSQTSTNCELNDIDIDKLDYSSPIITKKYRKNLVHINNFNSDDIKSSDNFKVEQSIEINMSSSNNAEMSSTMHSAQSNYYETEQQIDINIKKCSFEDDINDDYKPLTYSALLKKELITDHNSTPSEQQFINNESKEIENNDNKENVKYKISETEIPNEQVDSFLNSNNNVTAASSEISLNVLNDDKNISTEQQFINESKEIENNDDKETIKFKIAENVIQNKQIDSVLKSNSKNIVLVTTSSEISEDKLNTETVYIKNILLSEKSKQLLKLKNISNPNFYNRMIRMTNTDE